MSRENDVEPVLHEDWLEFVPEFDTWSACRGGIQGVMKVAIFQSDPDAASSLSSHCSCPGSMQLLSSTKKRTLPFRKVSVRNDGFEQRFNWRRKDIAAPCSSARRLNGLSERHLAIRNLPRAFRVVNLTGLVCQGPVQGDICGDLFGELGDDQGVRIGS